MINEESQTLPFNEQPAYGANDDLGGHNLNNFQLTKNEGEEKLVTPMAKITLPLVIGVLGAACGALQFGYNLSVINTPAEEIKAWINSTQNKDKRDVTVSLLFSVIVSIWTIGGLVGGLLAAPVADKFGRNVAMIYSNGFVVVAAALMAVAKPSNSVVPLIIGRLVCGINCGINTSLPIMYLTEIAPKHIRGALGVLNNFVVVFGILISQTIGLPQLLGTKVLWPYALIAIIIPAIIQPCLLLFAPESPRYLLINRGERSQAEDALKRLRGFTSYQDFEAVIGLEIRELEAEALVSRLTPSATWSSLFRSKPLFRALLVCLSLHLAQQLCGFPAILFYSTSLLRSAGLDEMDAKYATIGTSGLFLLMTIVSIPLIDRSGRRPLMLAGLFLIIILESLLTVSLSQQKNGQISSPSSISPPSSSPWVVVGIFCIYAFVAAFAIGQGSIPWFYPAEVFSQDSRAKAVSIAIAVNWLASFTVAISFEHLQQALGSFSFIPFIGITSVFWLYLFLKMPETKQMTVEEIQATFK